MNMEDMLTELFTEQAEHRPDAGMVLDDLHQRVGRQRRVTVTRAAGTLGAAAAVAAVAVGATMLTAAPDDRSAPGGATHPARPVRSSATSSAPLTSPATPRSSSPAPTPASQTRQSSSTPLLPSKTAAGRPSLQNPPGSRDYSTIDAGYLPGPATQDPAGTSNRPGFEERDWDVTVDGVAMDVIIWAETGKLPTRMQATGGKRDYKPITVNGHPGREFVSANATIVAYDLGDGTIAYAGPSVQYTTKTVTTVRITAIALRVAQNMQFNRHDPIPRN